MAISSSCVFHFTKSKEALKGILTDNFKLSYCREEARLGKGGSNSHVPMVSFCDLPLSQVKEHIASYGSYGIGLSKDWAKKNQLNPVLYIEKDSLLAESYYKASKYFISKKSRDLAEKQEKEFKDSIFALVDILGYVKNYKGDVTRSDGAIHEDYTFYNEREWRYVPKYEGYLWVKSAVSFGNEEYKARAIKKIEDARLKFEPNDIKYIIIESEDEISELVSHLLHAKSKFSYEDVQKLTTRIITLDQINNDI